MIKVGITGGIGSGKSLVCEAFSKLKVPVYNADREAKILTDTDTNIRKELTALMGENIYSGSTINTLLMAENIFSKPALLVKVNSIIHPRVARHFELWCNSYTTCPYIIQESAILFESMAYLLFDTVVTVTSPEEVRIQRVIARKNMNREKVLAVMKNQLPESEKIRRSDYVIINDGINPVIPQILHLHNLFTA
jgi:dephospho-CoA kinase